MFRYSISNMAVIMPMICIIISMVLSHTIMADHITLESTPESILETYIVHVDSPEGHVSADPDSLEVRYRSFLPKNAAGEGDSSRLVHSYRTVVSGFAAKLSPEEVEEMEKIDGFISARPQKKLSLHTTHTPNFLGLYQNLGFWEGSNYGEGVIIGLLDTGIAPGHVSFDDKDVPAPPAKWKGKCEFNGTACNNKLIGARSFVSEEFPGSPSDDEGHGTHTSSTAAGNFVGGAGVFGMANGTAVGMAPRAHIAMYKVCTAEGCSEADILAAMDAAVEDGVDVLSLSLGGGSSDFFADSIAVGAFAAIKKGIFVSCSAGNSGPFNASLSNEAPWILTVGASTIDRTIAAVAALGGANGGYLGESLFQPDGFSDFLPLVDAAAGANEDAALCGPGSLDNADVKGKVVLCERGGGIARIAKGQTVLDAGGAAMILMNAEIDGFSTLADPHVLPASHVSYYAGDKIRAYINSTSAPRATIMFWGTAIGNSMDPMVTSFSSRGPSLASPGILKPDIIGPGVSILAAWPVSVDNFTNENGPFNVISGTSMSCPHLSGIAALLKSAHPDWSPAAIKSAIMTTATQLNLANRTILDERYLAADIFAKGAGHVNPPRANDPGLIYDLQPIDYIPYLCGLGYSDKEIQVIVQQPVSCSNITSIPEAQLNYPSFAIELGATTKTYTRTVTNVGAANSSYIAIIELNSALIVDIHVTPNSLSFSEVNQKLTYEVSFSKATNNSGATYVEAALIWSSANSKHSVRSPISIKLV